MEIADEVRIVVDPSITVEQLYAFYQRNHICEEGYTPEQAARPLQLIGDN
jgi:hypothetical protein